MPDDGSAQSQQIWPLPKFYFTVDFGNGVAVPFQEVAGLAVEAEEIKYRAGNSPSFSVIKMPGLVKYGNVTLKKGVFPKDGTFRDWAIPAKIDKIDRRTVSVSLLDETGASKVTWTLKNAWVAKFTSADLKATGNEVAIESIELAHEGIALSSG